MEPVASRHQRFQAHHPERRDRDEEPGQPAWNPLLGEHQGAVANSQDDDAITGYSEFAATRDLFSGAPGRHQ